MKNLTIILPTCEPFGCERDGGGRRVLSREMEGGGGYSVERLRTKYEEREPGDGECMHEI